ncbi:polysaccharide deacetylase family protein [Ligilactobacillus sp. WILCCON 0076]|uniref:Polysaccharide deacetylase family protein n=1 Tax=Ligilactobacillus ubinensis TaxID=2876789 RepID=A0A9X2FJU1_9LACO|nr:polysaccharide deacetylase family protein [Ligilactobacillus ubinensis]MCP0887029.1 polysaccharide deacetylase family protein [Ligilactobacillus ubinensis]
MTALGKKLPPHVLDILEKYAVPATFMIWGEHALKYPSILKREAENSKLEFGNHTLTHTHLPRLPLIDAINNIKENDYVIKKIINKTPRFVRPPFGEFTTENKLNEPRPFIIWSLDTKSWDHHSKSKVLKNIQRAKDGDIILMHDSQQADVAALEDAINILHKNDFNIVSLDNLISRKTLKNADIIYSKNHIVFK